MFVCVHDGFVIFHKVSLSTTALYSKKDVTNQFWLDIGLTK